MGSIAAVAARRPAPSRPVTGQVPAEIKIVILITLSTVKLRTGWLAPAAARAARPAAARASSASL